jgi:hypothetical protein
VQTLIVNLAAHELRKIGTEDNLRTYIPEHSNKRRNAVHKAIEYTMETEPDRFINRNSGVTIAARSVEVDDKASTIKLIGGSIINGAQTRGEILRFLDQFENAEDAEEAGAFPVRAEIYVDPEHASIVETAIARNTATKVMEITTAGARGYLDELAAAFKEKTGLNIRTSETDVDVVESLHLLQVTRLLMPPEVSGNESMSEMLKPYKNKAQCLSDFSEWFVNRKTDAGAAERYQFVLDMAVVAFQEYAYWEKHPAWNGYQIWEQTKKGGRAVRRDKGNKIVWVSPGILFPLMNALSAFVRQDAHGKWVLDKPTVFKADELVKYAVKAFRAENSNPMDMGRSESAYGSLMTYTETLMSVMNAVNG